MANYKKFLYISGNTTGKKLADLKSEITSTTGKYYKTIVFAAETNEIWNRGKCYSLSADAAKDITDLKSAVDALQKANPGSAVQSATIGGVAVTKSGTQLQFPAYPTTLPASDVKAWAKADTKPTYTKSEVGLGNVTNDAQVKRTEMGAANGVATLDANGKVPSTQLPSFVDDVLEYATLSNFPTTGEAGKIYVALDSNKTYRWGGTSYVVISETISIGTTPGTAFDGKSGKDHVDDTTRHITSAERTAWNAKQNALTFNTAPSSTNKVATMTDVNNAVGGKNVSAEGDTYVSASASGNKVTVAATQKTKDAVDFSTDLKAGNVSMVNVQHQIKVTGGGGGSTYVDIPYDGISVHSGNNYASINEYDIRLTTRENGETVTVASLRNLANDLEWEEF